MNLKDRNVLLEELTRHLVELFELKPEQITLEARLKDDLDLDSIDAVDLIVKLQELIGRRISPTEFKSVETVSDVVEVVHRMVSD